MSVSLAMSPTAYPVECKNQLKRRHTPDVPADSEPLCAKRACPNLLQGKDDHEGKDVDSLSWLDESETAFDRSWLNLVDERAVCAMMCSLEQDIRSNEARYAEDSSSSSSCPLGNVSCTCFGSAKAGNDDGEIQSGSTLADRTSESDCSFNFIGESAASIDEEIQQLLQQAEDESVLPNFCANWDTCSSGSSDYMGAISAVYASENDLGLVVYNNNTWLDPCFDGIAFETSCT